MLNSIYTDIAKRTDGNIYIGVVGPVRTGKSTFISKFMNNLVIPNITNDFRKERALDELPQSAAGKTIMTTEPKFIPEEAVTIELEDGASMNVRMIDCVGYIVPASIGYIENEAPRMVKTPWFDTEIPFNMAAEVGTQKVINEHSTIGLVITTDGSITDIPRSEYEEVEERVIDELNAINKPFMVLLNCQNPNSAEAIELAETLSEKYNKPVLPINCLDLSENDIKDIITQILFQFPVKEINIRIPKWVTALKKDHWLKKDLFDALKKSAGNIKHISEVKGMTCNVSDSEYVTGCEIESVDLGKGAGNISVTLNGDLFYKILGEATGLELCDEGDLMPCMIDLARIKRKYEKIMGALDEVSATGYGIVLPSLEELTLEEPQIIKSGGRYGVKLKASAPSIHIVCNKQKYKISQRKGKVETRTLADVQRLDIYNRLMGGFFVSMFLRLNRFNKFKHQVQSLISRKTSCAV